MKEIIVPLKSIITLAALQWGQDFRPHILVSACPWLLLNGSTYRNFPYVLCGGGLKVLVYYCSMVCLGVNLTTDLCNVEAPNSKDDQGTIFEKLKKSFPAKPACLGGSVVQVLFMRQVLYSLIGIRITTFVLQFFKELWTVSLFSSTCLVAAPFSSSSAGISLDPYGYHEVACLKPPKGSFFCRVWL